MVKLIFGVQSYKAASLDLSAQRCVNAFCELSPESAKSQSPIYGSYGIDDFVEVGEGPIRGMIATGGSVYVVSRDRFFSIHEDGTTHERGAGITGAPGRASMAFNGTQISIVNGDVNYIYEPATQAFAQVASGDFHSARTVTYLDGYFIYDWDGTQKWFISNLLDGTTYDALAFASAESQPDKVITSWNRASTLYLFGEKTTETWAHTGALDFPFKRYQGGTIDRGIGNSPHAICGDESGIFFLGNDRVAYRILGGLTLQRISNHAIEQEWQKYSTVDDAFCFIIESAGHKFVHFTFPTASTTFCIDRASGLWHERTSFDPTGREVKWRANASLSMWDSILIGDANSGRVGKMKPTLYTEWGDPIITTLYSAPIHGGETRVGMRNLFLDMQTGVGLATGQGSDPQIMMDFSDDGGKSFRGPQLWQSMGAQGATKVRLKWRRLGQFYQRVVRVSISDPVFRALVASWAGLEGET